MTALSLPRGPRFGLLRQRRFRLLWIGETTSNLGSNVSSVALPLVALGVLHAHVFAVSLLSAAAWLPWLVIGLPAGAVVDRLPRRAVMLSADLVSIVAFASVPLASLGGWLTMTQLLVVALLAGCAAVFFDTAYRAFLPAMVAPQDLLEGNAKLQGSEQVTHVTGPGLAGLIAQRASPIGGLVCERREFRGLCRVPVPDRRRGAGPAPTTDDLRARSVKDCDRLAGAAAARQRRVRVHQQPRSHGLPVDPGRVPVARRRVECCLTGLLLATASSVGSSERSVARRSHGGSGQHDRCSLLKVGVMPFGLLIPLTAGGRGSACSSSAAWS